MPHATKPKPKPKTKTKGRGKGPLDPPGKIANTYSQLLAKPHISTPILPLIGCERQFQRRPMLKDGEGDEALEVGVLRYKQGPGIVSMSIELDSELLVGRDKSWYLPLSALHASAGADKVARSRCMVIPVRTSTSLSIVCMNDLSSGTGYIHNGKHFSSSAKCRLGGQVVGTRMIVLRDGDTIQIPNTPQVLHYKHNSKHYPISPSVNLHIGDHALFQYSSPQHYIDTNCWRIHNYPLGDGTFGVVNLATHKLGGVQAAIKTIDSRTSEGTWRQRLEAEVGNMRLLNHPNVMKVLDTIKNTGQSNPGKEKKIQDENDQEWDWTDMGIWKAHLVFELATGGDLFSYQESQGALSEDETKFIAYQLVLGLDHLHAHKVAHRDLKLENILLHNRNNFPRILIGDFGFSTTLLAMTDSVPPGSGVSYRHYTPAGTILYLPPERLKAFQKTVKTAGLGESLHGQARREKIGGKWFEEEMQLDNWALGVVVYHLIAFRHPFRGDSEPSSLSTIREINSGNNTKSGRGKKRQGKAIEREIETQETINQFPTQDQSTLGQGMAPTKTKRKFMELDVDEEDGDDAQRYSTQNASKGWEEYRKIHGEGTVGAGESNERRAAGRVLEEVKLFVDTHPDEWLPSEKWAEVSSEGVNFISDLLKMRVYQRMTVQCAKEHEWFKSSIDDLDKLYNQVVIKGIHRHPISDEV